MCDLITDEEVENFILKFLTKQKWEELGDIVKTRYRNMTRNYLSVPKDQNIMPLPDYICKPAYNKPNLHPKSTVKARNVESVEKVEPKVPIRKNPKRNVAQINYYEEAEPGEDRYVFCDNCGEEYLDYCSKCGVLKSLLDFPVPLGTEDRAKKTAPKGVLEVRPSKVHGFGVFASRHVRKGIQMGPYQGEITRVDTTNGYCWKLRDGRLIDGADETRSNWLRYVNCAKNVTEQNVIAFQYNGQIYYRTCRDVEKGEELLVYYGKSFAEVLGINTKKYFEPNSEEVDSDYYCCEFCKAGLSTRAYRDTHEKHCRFRPNRMVLCSKDDNFVCQFCECTLTKEEFLKKHEVHCSKNPKREIKSSGKETTFQCASCDKKFKKKWDLGRHEVIHDKRNAKIFSCQKCPYKTVHSSSLYLHMRTHESLSRLKCPLCQKGFNDKQKLDGHVLRKHAHLRHLVTSRIHRCRQCEYETTFITNLKRHLSVHDQSGSKRFQCDRCHYSTARRSRLKEHLLTHFPSNKPYVCVDCGNKFSKKTNLDGHILSKHQNLRHLVTSKIHRCWQCDYRTVHSSNLQRHIMKNH